MLLVDVRDTYFVRTKAARPGEDHIELTLAGHRLTIFPGDARAIPTLVRWGPRPAKKIKAVSALQQSGWAVELAMPMSAIPGYKAGMPLSYRATVADCDSKATLKTERTVDSVGSIVFAEGDSALEGFLKDRNLKRSDIWFDKGLSLGGKAGGRVVARRPGPGVHHRRLRVHRAADPRARRRQGRARRRPRRRRAAGGRAALRGAGRRRQPRRAGGLAPRRRLRDPPRLRRRSGQATPQGRLDDKVAFVKRGRATDIVIDAGAAPGLSAATWRESPADDMIPVMLPWAPEKDAHHARYQFSGDEYKRAQ